MGEIAPKIILTGAGGFIGRWTLRALAEAGHDVLALDLVPDPGNLPTSVQWCQTDLKDATPDKVLPNEWQDAQVIFVHLAWNLNRNHQFAPQAEQVQLLASLLDSWHQKGDLQKVVILGSAEEYGSHEGVLVEERDEAEPVSPYGWAKQAARELARTFSLTSNTAVDWLRPFIVYGPGQRGNMVIPYAIQQGLAGEMAQFSRGEQERDFIYVQDVAEMIARSAGQMSSGFRVMNLGRGEAVRVRDLLEEIGRQLNTLEEFEFGARPIRAGEPKKQVASLENVTASLGRSASTDWRSGIAQTIQAAREKR